MTMLTRLRWRRVAGIMVVALAFLTSTCSEARVTPSNPMAPASTASVVVKMTVGVLGSGQAVVAPGESLQLFAIAEDATGKQFDATNLAQWSSENPKAASISSGGLVTASTEGPILFTATYGSVSASINAQVVLYCAKSLSPDSRVFSTKPFVPCSDDSGVYGERVTVLAAKDGCNWTAESDVAWLGMDCYQRRQTYSGGNTLWYVPEWNNTPLPRTGRITVTFADGSKSVHTVRQEAPSCSYMVAPTEISVPRGGGSGSFQVTVTPETCQWTLDMTTADEARVLVSARSGTGSSRIDYQVLPNTSAFARIYLLSVNGLSGINPPGQLRIRQAQ